MPEYQNQKHQTTQAPKSSTRSSVQGVSSMEKSRKSTSSTSNATSFRNKVDNLVNNTQIKKENESKYGVVGGIVSGIQTSMSASARGQQLLKIFPAATQTELKAVAADQALVKSMIDKAESLKCQKCFDYLYKYITKVDLLKKLIDVRFGVPVGSENVSFLNRWNASKFKGDKKEAQWTVNGLIHVYSVYITLPQSHLDLIKGLMTFNTHQNGGSGAARGDLGMYFVNYNDDPSKDAFDPTNPINLKGKFSPDASYTRKKLASTDMTIAHELGHIVDANARGGRYSERFDSSGNPKAGSIVEVSGWKRHYKSNGISKLYADIKSCINAPYAVSSGGTLSTQEKKFVDLAGQKILDGRNYKDNKKKEAIKAAIPNSAVSTANKEALINKISHSAVIEHIIRADYEKNPHYNEPFSNLSSRQIHEDYLTQDWYSYSNNARAGQKISTYQFRNPGEEFAETYASYHVSNPKGAHTPQKLKTWFERAGLNKA